MLDISNPELTNALAQGFSIIPLRGTGENAKAPASHLRSWKQYQQTKATPTQVTQWLAQGMSAYGIIMGEVSDNLFAIDFDDRKIYAQFCKKFPQIAQSYSVQTRKGVHIYLQYQQSIKTMRFEGGDIIGEGSYVVGAESKICHQQQVVIYSANNKPIHTIAEAEWESIQKHLNVRQISELIVEVTTTASASNLQQYYQQRTPQGRNNALYQTAKQANNSGIPRETTMQQLVECHVQAPTPQGHAQETTEQRRIEAIKTIQSAYRVVGNTITKNEPQQIEQTQRQLPNNVREKLLRLTARKNNDNNYVGASAVLVRLVEALHREGYLATIISKKKIKQIASKYKLSTTSVEKIIHSETADQIGIKQVSYSEQSNPPLVREGERKNTFSDMYRIPGLNDLLDFFEIVPKAVDMLADEDLYSNRHYLQAMHREFIKRTNADTSTAFCANRLSITPRTLQNYDTALNVIKTEVIHYVSLTWQTVDGLMFSSLDNTGITPGMWLQNEQGKRFPATKGIALSRLKAQENLILCTQKSSIRYLPDPAMIYHEAWWVALDGTRWGGGAYDFPPQVTPDRMSGTSSDTLIEAKLDQKSPKAQGNHSSTYDAYNGFEAREKQRIKSIYDQVQQQRKEQLIKINNHINSSLTLIKGIGNRISDELRLVGIDLMTDLIALGADSVATIFDYNQYISPHTTQKWIDQAELLLGLRKPRADELVQQRVEVRQQLLKDYTKMYRNLQTFVNQLVTDDEQHNIQLTRFKRRLDIWREHPYLFTTHKFDEVKARVVGELQAYLTHIQLFLDIEDDSLVRWGLGSKTHWQKRYRQAQKHLTLWQEFCLTV